MELCTMEEMRQARRAIRSLRNKSEKSSGKLKEGTWQKKQMDSCVKASDIALQLMEAHTVTTFEREALDDANKAVKDALLRAEAVIGKFATGSSQHTLQKNRIAALKIALHLIEMEQV